jgi:hypothetical protein
MSDFDFEIIDEQDIERVARGRKSNVDPTMVVPQLEKGQSGSHRVDET